MTDLERHNVFQTNLLLAVGLRDTLVDDLIGRAGVPFAYLRIRAIVIGQYFGELHVDFEKEDVLYYIKIDVATMELKFYRYNGAHRERWSVRVKVLGLCTTIDRVLSYVK
jgi:hypothetical protein